MSVSHAAIHPNPQKTRAMTLNGRPVSPVAHIETENSTTADNAAKLNEVISREAIWKLVLAHFTNPTIAPETSRRILVHPL